MGYEYTQVKDFLEDKGLPEYGFDYFIENFRNSTYVNPLFLKEEEQKIGADGFEYYDP